MKQLLLSLIALSFVSCENTCNEQLDANYLELLLILTCVIESYILIFIGLSYCGKKYLEYNRFSQTQVPLL